MSSVEERALPDASPIAATASAVDGMLPREVVAPASEAELAETLAQASREHSSIVAVGGGTHLCVGNPPQRLDIALSTARMNAIVAYEPADMTVTVQPGVLLRDLRELLEAQRQMLPLDPPGAMDGGATIGGALSANVQGPLRHSHGTARDWVIGMRVALANGTVIKSGGRVVKNVTGYDLHKLFIGALGTLGVITEVTFKLSPRPPVTATVAATFDSAGAAAVFAASATTAGYPMTGCELLCSATARTLGAGDGWCVLVRVEAGERAVARSVADLETLARSAGGSATATDNAAWTAWSSAFAPRGVAMHVSVLPSDLPPLLAELDEAFGDQAAMSATASAGLIRLHLPDDSGADAIARAREIAGRHGASTVVVAAPSDVKAAIGDVFGPPRPDISIMRRLKDEYDSQRVLAPGRFVGGI
jgi:glycolate oxidase FAD binding subunit